MELISASAVLHQRQRDRDRDGRVIADRRDYELDYQLAGKTFGVIPAGGVTLAVRKVVAAIMAHVAGASGELVSQVQVADQLGLDKSVVSRHIRAAIKAGHIVNEESRRGHPMKLRPGNPLPAAKPALPVPDELFRTQDTLATDATVQPRLRNPQNGANLGSCTGGCTVVAHPQSMQPLTFRDASVDATLQAVATPDLGVSTGKTGEELQSCTVAPGVPDTLPAYRVCLDCGLPIGAGFCCQDHGGDGEDHEAAEAWATAAPDDLDDGWSGEHVPHASEPVLSGSAGHDRWIHKTDSEGAA